VIVSVGGLNRVPSIVTACFVAVAARGRGAASRTSPASANPSVPTLVAAKGRLHVLGVFEMRLERSRCPAA
jgi:hypothetical protein